MKATISLDEVIAAKPELDMIQIENTDAGTFTVLRKELFNGPWATLEANTKQPTITRWTKNAKEAVEPRHQQRTKARCFEKLE